MNIALFSATIDPRDGYGNITKEYCSALYAKGAAFTLFLPCSQQDCIDPSRFPFEIRFVLPEYIFRIFQPKALGYFRSVDVSEFDLVHSLFAFPYCILAANSAKKYRKPFMMGAQGTHGVRPLTYFPEKYFLKHCYKQAKAITVPSQYTKEMITQYAGAKYPISVIHNGVHFDRFQNDVDTESVRSQFAGKKILLTVGGLWGRKGHDLMLRSLPVVLEKHPDTVYVMVGDGNGREGLEQLADELGITDCVHFAGRKSGDELVAYFQACDIYVHTPRVTGLKFEGFGIVYLEASACGKPIVAADSGGIRDAVLEGETGLIAGDGNTEEIAKHVVTLLDDPDLASRLGEAGEAYAKKNDWNAIAEQFQDLYSELHA